MDNLIPLLTTADGRISRQQWWIGTVVMIVISIALSIVLAILGLGPWGQLVVSLALLYPSYCIGVKRRHDRDNDGLDVKILLGVSAVLGILQAFGIGFTVTDAGNGVMVPSPDLWLTIVYIAWVVAAIYVLVQLGFLKGTPGPNSYGADPLGHAVAA
jgi:uncharacterized membrane protein YhaH (DUF805 family)